MRIVSRLSYEDEGCRPAEGLATRPRNRRRRGHALFQYLEHGEPALNGALVLARFAGSGALASSAVARLPARSLLEIARQRFFHHPCQRQERSASSARLLIQRIDATRPPRRAPQSIRLDGPPYKSGLARPAFGCPGDARWICPGRPYGGRVAAGEDSLRRSRPAIVDERKYGAQDGWCFCPVRRSR